MINSTVTIGVSLLVTLAVNPGELNAAWWNHTLPIGAKLYNESAPTLPVGAAAFVIVRVPAIFISTDEPKLVIALMSLSLRICQLLLRSTLNPSADAPVKRPVIVCLIEVGRPHTTGHSAAGRFAVDTPAT